LVFKKPDIGYPTMGVVGFMLETAEIQNDNPFVREILATGVELL
jgi:hypothetical protein